MDAFRFPRFDAEDFMGVKSRGRSIGDALAILAML
jgi:hypothetical protein